MAKKMSDGGASSDKEFDLAIDSYKKKLKGQGAISDDERKAIRSFVTGQEKKYPSGLTDSDIDKVLSSKEVKEGASRFSDYKRGGKAKKSKKTMW
jgi:hypothetical protein